MLQRARARSGDNQVVHARFAVDGFDLDAADFLHKPFSYERFEKAVDKALRILEARSKDMVITVKQEYNNVLVAVSDIIYI